MLPVNRRSAGSDTYGMPIGRLCRSCGAALPPDLRWCAMCFAPATPFAARPPLHEPGTFVGTPMRDHKTSRWRSGPTTMGPLGRIGWTVGLLLLFPWWALVVPMMSIWRKERVADDAPPTFLERFRLRHPTLGREIRLSPTARLAIARIGGRRRRDRFPHEGRRGPLPLRGADPRRGTHGRAREVERPVEATPCAWADRRATPPAARRAVGVAPHRVSCGRRSAPALRGSRPGRPCSRRHDAADRSR